jgi:uncharacterized protein YjdB
MAWNARDANLCLELGDEGRRRRPFGGGDHSMRVVARCVASLAAAALVACGGDTTSTSPPVDPVAMVTVSPTEIAVSVNGTTTLSAQTRTTTGLVVSDRSVLWTSSSTAIARVSTTGVVTGVGTGTVTITASSEGRTGEATVTVVPEPVNKVTITPGTASVMMLGTVSLSADVRTLSGVVATDRVVQWITSDFSVAQVSPAGVVTGIGPGTAKITAVSENRAGDAVVTVTPQVPVSVTFVSPPTTGAVGIATNLTAVVRDSNSNAIAAERVTWSVSNSRIAVTAPNGDWTTCATAEGATCAFAGTKKVRYGDGSTFYNTQATNGAVCAAATFAGDPFPNHFKECWYADLLQSTGSLTLRPVQLGTVTVTATSLPKPTLSASTTLTISPGTVTRWAAIATCCVGDYVNGSPGTAQYVWPIPFDAALNALTIPIRATSSDPSVATVANIIGSEYRMSAIHAGTATITFAPDGEFTGPPYPWVYNTVSFTTAPIATVAVTAAATSIAVGANTLLTTVLKDASDKTVTGWTISYQSADPKVAAVSATGVVTGIAPGVTTVVASSEGYSGLIVITVASSASP